MPNLRTGPERNLILTNYGSKQITNPVLREKKPQIILLQENISIKSTTNSADVNSLVDLGFIADQLKDIFMLLENIESRQIEYENNLITKESKINSIKELLIRISWRCNEISKTYKYNPQITIKGIKILDLFAERNWLLLDSLAEKIISIDLDSGGQVLEELVGKMLNHPDYNGLEQIKNGEIASLKNFVTYLLNPNDTSSIVENDKIEFRALNPLHLKELDSFVSHHLDRILLEKIIKVCKDASITATKDFKIKIAILLRVFEIVGECAQNLSYNFRRYYFALPWATKDRNDKKSLLHDFRNIIHHDREKLELVISYNHGLLERLLSVHIPFMFYASHSIRDHFNSNGTGEAHPTLEVNTYQATYKEKYLNNRLEEDLRTCIEKVNKFPDKLGIAPLINLLELVRADTRSDLFAMLTNGGYQPTIEDEAKKEKEFLGIVNTWLDINFLIKQNINEKSVMIRFRDAYRIVTGKKLTVSEIENAFPLQDVHDAGVEKIKENVISFFENDTTIPLNDFEKGYLEPLAFDNENDKPKDKLRQLFIACVLIRYWKRDYRAQMKNYSDLNIL